MTGERPRPSLILAPDQDATSSRAFVLDPQAEVVAVGCDSIFAAAAAAQRLRGGLRVMRPAAETEGLAAGPACDGGVYVAPAFTGLVAPLLAALILGLAARAADAAPLRVMSLNVCTDQLVLALLPPGRITSVTWLARDAGESQMWRAAGRVRVNHGLAEEVVRDHPDLVIAGSYTTPATRALLRRLRFPVLTLQPAESFRDIRRTTLELADAVGEAARGRVLAAHLDATLAALDRDRGPPLRVAAWDEAGVSAAPGSLYDSLLTAAGARNVAADRGALGDSAPEVERLLAAAPELLVTSAPAFRTPGLHQDAARHPLVRRFWKDRTVVVPLSAYLCGTPFSADAAVALRAELRGAAARARTPLPYRAAWTR